VGGPDTLGVIFLGVLALVLLFAFLCAQKRIDELQAALAEQGK